MRRLLFLFLALVLFGCNEDDLGEHLVAPAPDIPSACRHEAVRACLIAVEQFEEEPVILRYNTTEGLHAECYVAGYYVHGTFNGVLLDDAPLLDPVGPVEEWNVFRYIETFFNGGRK